MKTTDLADRRQHRLGRRRGRARDVHAGRLRVPRGGPHADEERRRTSPARTCSSSASARSSTGPSASGSRSATATASIGTSGFFPSVDDAARRSGRRRSLVLLDDPGRRRLPVRGRLRRRLAGDRLGRDGRAREALGLLRLRRRLHASSTRSSRTGSGSPAAGCSALGMQDFAGSTVVHYQGALAALAGRAAARPADRQVRPRRAGEPDPGPQHAVRRPRDAHPLVRLVRLQPGLDARRRDRRARRLTSPTSR